MVRISSQAPSMNRKVTAAASQYSPIANAPAVATVTSNSMLRWRTRKACHARTRSIGLQSAPQDVHTDGVAQSVPMRDAQPRACG